MVLNATAGGEGAVTGLRLCQAHTHTHIHTEKTQHVFFPISAVGLWESQRTVYDI